MRSEKRGLQGIRTTRALLDNRRVRTPGGALLELSALANERLLLEHELERWRRRHVEIEERLATIRAKEARLLVVARLASPEASSSSAAPVPPCPTPAAVPGRRIRATEFQY